jgi:urease accessory protein
MLITEKAGNIFSESIAGCEIDAVNIEWHETNKRILHKFTNSGIQVTLKFLRESPDLKDGDILWRGENKIIIVEIIPCECIVISPCSLQEASGISYEIGNRHQPLFFEGNELLVPYDVPLHNLLQTSGYELKVEKRKLRNAFKTTVLPDLSLTASFTLINKIP